MKILIWLVTLFAIAVGMALLGHYYNGLVVVFVGAYKVSLSLNLLVVLNIVFLAVLYFLFRFVAGVLRLPAHLRAGRLRRARRALNTSALAYFEGQYHKSLQQSGKALKQEDTPQNQALALMLSAASAQQTNNLEQRDESLAQMKKLPEKFQLSRFLFEAEQAIKEDRLAEARTALDGALGLSPNLSEVLKLDLQLSAKEKKADKTLLLANKLLKNKAIDEKTADDYRVQAYREQLTYLTHEKDIRKWIKGIPEEMLTNALADEVALKFQQLGLNEAVVDWVSRYYPKNKHPVLLGELNKAVLELEPAKQQKVLEQGENWLKTHSAKDSELLLSLGKIACANQLWGKAQSYLEASISIAPSFEAYFALSKLFNETDKKEMAKEQNKKALALAEKINIER